MDLAIRLWGREVRGRKGEHLQLQVIGVAVTWRDDADYKDNFTNLLII
jgi:hypothetical protein